MKKLTPTTISGSFSTMDAERLRQVNGGGFAYDVGRGLRYLAIYVTQGWIDAMVDAIVNDVLNEAANN